MSWKLV